MVEEETVSVKNSKKLDPRILRSKKALKDAFIVLVKEKGYKNVQVKDILARALIDKKTFYTYYRSKDSLYNEIIEDIVEIFTFREAIESLSYASTREEQRERIILLGQNLIEKARNHRELIITIFNQPEGFFLEEKLKKELKKHIIDVSYKKNPNKSMAMNLVGEMIVPLFTFGVRWAIENLESSKQEYLDAFLYVHETDLITITLNLLDQY